MDARLTYGDVEGFVTMMLVACEDAGVNATLERILSLPDPRRRFAIRTLLESFRAGGAPKSLQEAFACLLDDDVAERAYAVMFKCRRPG